MIMIGLNDYIPIHVQTTRGAVSIENILPGDIVYEYGTGKELRVTDVDPPRMDWIIEAVYNDGRTQIYRFGDSIYTGKGIKNVIDSIISEEYYPIGVHELELHNKKVSSPLYPDPYIAGALIIFGRYDSSYINLPLDRNAANQLFAHKYDLDFADKLEDNTTFYCWNGEDKSIPITWKEFFPNYDMYVTTKQIYSPLIPDEYTRASIINRKKFIRGVFDTGYSKDMFPDTVGIAHTCKERLEVVQNMLWSLGVLSKITYDPNLPLSRGRIYRLDVIGDYDGYPGFFYDINAIRKTLDDDNKLIRKLNPFQLRVMTMRSVSMNGATIDRGYMQNIHLEKPSALYVTDNFLPRVSV